MPNDNARRPAFDEQAALQELERLRDAIEATRRLRSERSDEFDAFVRSFRAAPPTESSGASIDDRPSEPRPEFTYPGRQNRDPQPKPPAHTVVFDPPLEPAPPREIPPPPAVAPAPPPAVAPAVAPVPPPPAPEQITARATRHGEPPQAPSPLDPWMPGAAAHTDAARVEPWPAEPAPVAEEPHRVPAALAADAPARPRRASSRSVAAWAVVGAVVVIGAAAIAVKPWASRTPESSEPASSASPSPAASAPAPEATPSPQATAPAPAPAASSGTHAIEAELIADRRVWVRVVADGEKLVERELPAGTRVPITADRAIVVRAGDAGAVRLRVNGADRGPLGRDAEVLTRTFTAAER